MRRIALIGFCAAILGGCGSSNTFSYRVPSGSMLPTLQINEVVQVSLSRNYVPAVGDIVALHPPAGADPSTPVCGDPSQGYSHRQACSKPTSGESSQTFVKRIVAGPGDTFAMKGGRVVVNGAVVNNSGYTSPCVGVGSGCDFPAPIKVPAGYYFVLGDNLPASDDSRFWGPVPRSYIIGKVER